MIVNMLVRILMLALSYRPLDGLQLESSYAVNILVVEKKQMIQLTGTVRNGKIEVTAPSDLADGTRVALLMLNSTLPDSEQMDDSELSRTLAAMENFAAAFPENECGEDLSRAARESADWEKSQFEPRAKKLGSQFE
jgi:hypothetical protein